MHRRVIQEDLLHCQRLEEVIYTAVVMALLKEVSMRHSQAVIENVLALSYWQRRQMYSDAVDELCIWRLDVTHC